MSLEPLRISAGSKFAAVCATIGLVLLAVIGFCTGFLFVLLLDPLGRESSTPIELAVGLLLAIVVAAIGQVLILAALGRFRTRGGPGRYARYQLLAFGIGIAISTALYPLFMEKGVAWWLVCIAGAIVVAASSLLLLLPARYRPLEHPPHPKVLLVPATVIHHWNPIAANGPAPPQFSVIRYRDEQGRERFARHLYRQALTARGVVGQAQIERSRQDRVLRFSVPEASKRNVRMQEMRDIARIAREAERRDG